MTPGRNGAVSVGERRHLEALDARPLVAAAVDRPVLHARVAGEVGFARRGCVIAVAAVDRRRTGAEAVVAVAREPGVFGVVLRRGRAVHDVAPEDAVVGGTAVTDAAGVDGVVGDRAVVERGVVNDAVVGRVAVNERVAVRAVINATAVAFRRAAADDAPDRVRIERSAAVPATAILDDAIDERATARATAVVVGVVVQVGVIAVLEREARERRRRRETRPRVNIEASVRASAVDDRRGRAVLGADVERHVARDDDARVGAVRDADRRYRVVGVGGHGGVDRVDCGLYASEGVGPGRAVFVSGTRGRHVEVREGRENRTRHDQQRKRRASRGLRDFEKQRN